MRLPYVTIGSIFALIGVNVVSYIFNLPAKLDYVTLNHIGEAVSILGIVGLAEIIFPKRVLKNYLLLAPIVILVGAIWEPLSFLALGGGLKTIMQIEVPWLVYGSLTIIAIGIPILIISKEISDERKILGLNATGWGGLLINGLVCMLWAMVTLALLFHFNVFQYFEVLLKNSVV